jgi:hypothetical protein
MNIIKLSAVAGFALAVVIRLDAQTYPSTIWSDNFSSYNIGDLDANEVHGANQSANGTGSNPWWGPNSPNLAIATSYNGITPYPGDTKLADGNSAGNNSEEVNNIGFRLNSGNNFMGNIALSWAFYDPAGAGGNASGYKDMVYLNGYQSGDGYTSTKDYTGTGPDLILTHTAGDEILGLGAGSVAGINTAYYQARVINATAADDGATFVSGSSGWFNLSVPRTVGWHTASIVVGAPNGANTTVSLWLDGHDVLDETVGTESGTSMIGVNSILALGGWGSQVGAFDNFAVSVPEPGTGSLLICGLAWLALRRRLGKSNG